MGVDAERPDRVERVERVDFLAGVRVLEVGDGVAGAAATSLLWSLGADVTTAIDPGSPHRRARPCAHEDRAGASLLSIVLDRGKHRVELADGDDLGRALAGADGSFDLVVVDRVGGVSEALSDLGDVDAYAEFVDAHAGVAWTTISAFGLDGPRRADVATEMTLAAASGVLGAVDDPRTGHPLKLAGWQCLLGVGLTAALASCDALDRATRAEGVHLDLSALDAAIALGPVLAVDSLFLDTRSDGGARRNGAPAGHYPCRDGAVRITVLEDHQWQGVVEALDTPDWAARFDTVAARIARSDEVDRYVTAWTSTRTKADAEARLQTHGVPAVQMSSPEELLHSPQLVHRDAFDTVLLDDGREARVVGLPFRLVGDRAPAPDVPRPTRSLRGLRVVELTHVLAAPLAGALLGALGADVIKVEDLGRVDMYRRRGPYVAGEAGVERSAYFALANHSKRNAVFDVAEEPGVLAALLDQADVVLENVGRRRAAALGVAASSLAETRPDVLAVSSSGFGHDGPHADYRAYAYSLHTACGLAQLTCNEHGETADIDLGWADLVTAYALATIIAAWAVGPRGNPGAALDVAMLDLTVARFNEHLAAASLDGDCNQAFDRGNQLAPYAPNGVYPTADGWVALSVDGDGQRRNLAAVLSDEPIEVATRCRGGAELAAALRAAGVPAEVLRSAADLVHDAELIARCTFAELAHPVWGPRRIVGLPWRPFGQPALELGSPPLLPEGDTRCV